MTRPATTLEQKYLDRAAHYVEGAMACSQHDLLHEAATNYGSALESLLRIRFGSEKYTLAALLDKFDKDPLFKSIAVHEDGERKCATCFADKIRVLRNAVHPNCWKTATKKDVDEAAMMVAVLHHVLASCDGSKIAVFRESPESPLVQMERSGITLDGMHQAKCPNEPDYGRLKSQQGVANVADGLLDVRLERRTSG